VAADVVRAWGRDNIEKIPEAARACLGEGARGLLHSEVITGFNRSHKNMKYETGTPREATVSKVTIMTLSANGRKVPRVVPLTPAEVKELTGHTGRGRIPNSVKVEAAFLKTGAQPVPEPAQA